MKSKLLDSFKSRSPLKSGDKTFDIFRLEPLAKSHAIDRLPYSMRIFLENLLRHEDGHFVNAGDVRAAADWTRDKGKNKREASFMPARVLMQDFTGVPAVVDLAAMRDAVKKTGGSPDAIQPLVPVDLVIDHSIQVDHSGTPEALALNSKIEFERNKERYQFLNWGQKAFQGFRVIPPETGIVHQVNLEYLAKVVWTQDKLAYPDTLVGTDSHTTMINGLGVLGWGVGGIEAEAVMLGLPVAMLIPEVIGMKLSGKLPEGATATDAVLTIVEALRQKGVVGKFVEFYGPGLGALSLADRATIANMGPEYGATVGLFPIDNRTLEYLAVSNRSQEQIRLVEDYAKAQGLFRTDSSTEPEYTDTIELDLGTIKPSIAGPKRPQDRIELEKAGEVWKKTLKDALANDKGGDSNARVKVKTDKGAFELAHGAVVIGAITSCTNTSNPSVMIAAGLVAKKAAAKGLKSKPWVKTSLAPGSKVVVDYLKEAGLITPLEQLGFHVVGYGCTTCIGNSGPLAGPLVKAIEDRKLVVTAVLSGNRNFEGRVSPYTRANYLASPPLVVAYALAGTMDISLMTDSLGEDKDGKPVFLKDIWPTNAEILKAVERSVKKSMFADEYGKAAKGSERWQAISAEPSALYAWDESSTYVQNPPYFEDVDGQAKETQDITGARALMVLGDSVTTDHISPAGSIAEDSPAGKYLLEHGVAKKDFNSYGSRRGNHEVMMRGTFANIRIRNKLLGGTVEGGVTAHLPGGEQMSAYDAAMRYRKDGVPTIVLGGAEYGTGSSRDWAAKGPALLGVKAVIVESFERIHRSNLVGMGVLPLQFKEGENAESLGLTGREVFSILGLAKGIKPGMTLKVEAQGEDKTKSFKVLLRVDTPAEIEYIRYGGILSYVLSQLASKEPATAS